MKQQRGSIVVFAILMLAVVLASALGLARIFTPKIGLLNEAGQSLAAIYAADSATEFCLYEARKNAVPPVLPNPLLTNTATYTIASLSATEVVLTLVPSNPLTDCRRLGTGSFSFRATGIYRNVSRSLEINQ